MSVQGTYQWYELMTPDTEAAKAFYTEVVGWKIQSMTVEGGAPMPYDMWAVGDTPIGGLMALTDEMKAMGAPPCWMAYIGSDDVDRDTKRTTEAGGKVLQPPFDVPTVGRMAILQDPTGAAFALFTPAAEGTPPTPPSPGRFSWHECMAEDGTAAMAFYAELLGWQEVQAMDMGEHGKYRIFSGGQWPLGGMMTRPAEMPVSAWVYYVQVDDLDAAVERVRANGGQIANGPMEVPGGDRVCQCIDPQGAMFALHQANPDNPGS